MAHGWTVVVGLKQVCGTGFRRATLCSMRKRPFSVTPRFQFASADQPFILLVYPLCFMVHENGPSHKVCSNRFVPGSWVNYDVLCAFEDDHMRAGWLHEKNGAQCGKAAEKHNQLRIQNLAMKRVKIAASQMASCPNDTKGRRYWEEVVT